MRSVIRFVLLAILPLFAMLQVSAQCEPQLMPDSNQFMFPGGEVKCVATYNNKTYVGGEFKFAGKYTGNAIRIDRNTGKTLNLNTWPKVTGIISTVVPDGSGGYFVGGQFTALGSTLINNLARIDANGLISAWNPNPNSQVKAMVVVGNTLYIGGYFTNTSGQTRNRLASYDITTGNLSTWDPNVTGSVVNTIAIDGQYAYVAGAFTNIGGMPRTKIGAVDITTGIPSSWAPAVGGTGSVNKVVVSGNVVYIGGYFPNVNGTTRNNLAAIDKTTAALTTWNPNATATVNDILHTGTSMYIAGMFSIVGGQPRASFGEVDLNTGLALSTNLNLGSFSYTGPEVYSIVKTGTDVYLGGNFSTGSSYQDKYNLLKMNATTGTIASNWTCQVDSTVFTMALYSNEIYVSGQCLGIGIHRRNGLAGLDMTGDSVTAFNPFPNIPGTNWQGVTAIAANANAVYFGGDFSDIDGTARARIAAADPVTGAAIPTWNPGMSTGSQIFDLELQTNTLYVAGVFSQIGGQNRMGLASVSSTNGSVNSWDPTLGAPQMYVRNMLIRNNTMYLAGGMTAIGGQNRSNFAAVDLTTGGVTSWDPDADSYGWSMTSVNDSIYTGGQFTTVNVQTNPNLRYFAGAFVYTSGAVASWDPSADDKIVTMCSSNGIIYVGGPFYGFAGGTIPRKHAAALDLNGVPTSWDPDPNDPYTETVNELLISGNKLYMSGLFKSVTGSTIGYVGNLAIYSLPNVTIPVVVISGNATTCSGTAATYTATTNVTGGTYQWQVNGVNVGTNSNTYTYTPTNNDQVTCIVTVPGGSCYSMSSVTSNTITMSVTSSVTPTITIAGPNTVCTGGNGTYTATTNVTGGTYQWQVNGSNAGTNSNSHTYNPTTGDQVTCIITVPGTGCYTAGNATSNTITVTVTSPVTPTISISGNTTVCATSSSTYTATTNITGGTYQWQVNGSNVGSNSSTYSYVPVNGDQVSCIITTPSGCYTTNTATSNTITITVTPQTVPTISISAPTPVAVGNIVNVTAVVTNAGTNYNIDWKNNGVTFDNTTVPSTSYTKAAGQDNITAIITPVGCYTIVTSNTATVDEPTSVGNVAGQNVITVYPDPFTNSLTITQLNAGDQVKIYDLLGKKVQEWTAASSQPVTILHVKGIPEGVYVLDVEDANGNSKLRMTVQKK